MTELVELKIGDVIYNDSRWSGLEKYVIDKVTATTASSGKLKFQRSYNDDCWLTTIPRQKGFSYNSYQLATKELDEKYEKLNLLSFIEKRIKKAELFQLRQIRDILK
jgi:hypothetical protein